MKNSRIGCMTILCIALIVFTIYGIIFDADLFEDLGQGVFFGGVCLCVYLFIKKIIQSSKLKKLLISYRDKLSSAPSDLHITILLILFLLVILSLLAAIWYCINLLVDLYDFVVVCEGVNRVLGAVVMLVVSTVGLLISIAE